MGRRRRYRLRFLLSKPATVKPLAPARYRSGVRVAPNLFTELKDLDALVLAIEQLSRQG